jgi:hypothetical protein
MVVFNRVLDILIAVLICTVVGVVLSGKSK